jgi:hypothetical protein
MNDRYYLRRGDESQCEEELQRVIRSVEEFVNIQLVVTLVVSRPFPRLNELLALLRAEYKLVRLVVVSLERPPKQIVASSQLKSRHAPKTSPIMLELLQDSQSDSSEGGIDAGDDASKSSDDQGPSTSQQTLSTEVAEGTKEGFARWGKITVAAGSKGKVELEKRIEKVPARLCWRFKTEGNDISFGVVYQQSASSSAIVGAEIIAHLF